MFAKKNPSFVVITKMYPRRVHLSFDDINIDIYGLSVGILAIDF